MFKITIEEMKPVTKKVGKEWTVTGQRMELPKEDAGGMFSYRSEPEREDGRVKVNLKPVNEYGYTPEIEKTVDTTTKIFEQTVDTLDMAAVIKAINNLT